MAKDADTPNLFNPFVLWADLGLRATEMTVASAQSMTNGADQVTRAVAGVEADQIANTAPAGTGLEGITNMQRLAWDMAEQNWLRWMSTVGSLMSAAAGASRKR